MIRYNKWFEIFGGGEAKEGSIKCWMNADIFDDWHFTSVSVFGIKREQDKLEESTKEVS